MNTRIFDTLNKKDVVMAGISDHHPIIHEGSLFWNVMMRGRYSESRKRYNNGFGLVESEKDYTARLTLIGKVIGEIINNHPEIETINLCEGPIEPTHIDALMNSMLAEKHMQRFSDRLNKPDHADAQYHWGLIMLADNRYEVTEVKVDLSDDRLKNRFQVWQLNNGKDKKYVALTHLPFAGDVHTTNRAEFSTTSINYREIIQMLLTKFKDEDLTINGDFNFSQYLMSQYKERLHDSIPHHNSVLFHNGNTETVTVDAVLLSDTKKQKCYQTPISQCLGAFFKKDLTWIEKNRHQHAVIQHAYDSRLGLIPS